MTTPSDPLPADLAAAHAMILAQREQLTLAKSEVTVGRLEIERLKLMLAKARREQFGQSSERGRLLVEQLELAIEDLEETQAEQETKAEIAAPEAAKQKRAQNPRPPRRPLPDNLPVERIVEPAPCACGKCGSERLHKLGEVVSKTLECEPRRWKIIEHVREKFSCRDCEAITEAPAPSHPIPRGFAGPSLLAMVLVNKFLLHQPLNRQSKTYAREGIEIDVSTLADRVGACVVALAPIIEAIRAHVMSAERIHADDTTVPVLAKLKTVTGRIWTYVRDDRPFGGKDPPAAAFYYSRSRAGEHPQGHLAGYVGLMQADAFDGYNQLYKAQRKPAPILEAACWSHGRRKFVDLVKQGEAPIASEAVRRIDMLFEIERSINGQTPEQRLAVRRERSRPLIADLEIWMRQQRALLSTKNDTAKGDQLPSQPLGSVHPLPRRWPRLSYEQRRRTSVARCGGRKKKLDLRRFGCWRPSCRRRLYPDRNLQDERRRSPSLARRRAGPPSRSPRQQSRRAASLELEGEPTVQGRRRCLSASRQTIAPAWGAGRMRTILRQFGQPHKFDGWVSFLLFGRG